MRRIALAVAAAVAGLSTVVLGPVNPAMAEDADCTPYVLDHTTNHLLAGQINEINGGVAKMTSLGANVRIRVEENFPDGAEGYIASMLTKCPSWRGTKSQVDTNMVLLIYATSVNGDYSQRPARIVVGSHWAEDRGMDDGTLNKLIVNDMRPTLLKYSKDNPSTWQDVPDGIAAGEKALADDMKPTNYWPWIIGGSIVLVVIIGGCIWYARSGRGSGGYYRGGGNYYGGSTFIGGSSDFGGGGGGGGDSGSVNC